MPYTTCFLHVDLDAFYASVEQLDNPDYRGKPVIVGGLPEEPRSVVSTASYEARAFGIHSAMPTKEAYRRCPQGIFVRGRMARYLELSKIIMDICTTFSPHVEQLSIDEAFIDLTGTERLFGNQKDTALKIKRIVREQTGLTVSIGIASNRYLAKIASGIDKPDGLTVIPPGGEESCIHSLPIESLWGIGSKTRKKIYDAGLYTTQDIYNQSCETLCALFGTATGNFLYATVRGQDNGAFSTAAKSHSVSAERTFSTDITDCYTAETVLLELSEIVMFRLLREHQCGRTVIVKLRYDDFTTTTMQDSSGTVAASTALFQRACRLFETHYQSGRGIRLLGVAVGTIGADTAAQQELFPDERTQKQQAVEHAILSLEHKHPDIKISKARLLKNKRLLIVAFCIHCLMNPPAVSAAEERTATGAGTIVTGTTASDAPVISPDALFNYTRAQHTIALRIHGYWQAELFQNTTATVGYGTPFSLSFGVPVFQQKIDLTASFLLNDRLFVDASFADEFRKNTIALGYRSPGMLREIRIANRGVLFPTGYSVDLFDRSIGGGDNQAPGISVRFEDPVHNRWHADAVIRYDMTTQRSATFYGAHSVDERLIPLSSYITGRQFVIPSAAAVAAIQHVYVESPQGTHTDGSGRTYRELSSDDYLIYPTRGELVIARGAGTARTGGKLPQIIVTFSDAITTATLMAAIGSYGTSGTFLGDIQEFFNTNKEDWEKLRVEQYSFARTAADFFTTINGDDALILQSPAGFSPFAVSARYDMGTTGMTVDSTVISQSTKTVSQHYATTPIDSESFFSASAVLSDSHQYVDIVNANASLNPSSGGWLPPARRFPCADRLPEIYLGGEASIDTVLSLKTMRQVSRYDIGTDAAAGSVRVYRNGVRELDASYDAHSGTVSLASAVHDTDTISITWNEDAAASRSGAVAAAVGFFYQFTPALSSNMALTTLWPLAPNRSFSDSTHDSRGFVTFAGGVQYANTPDAAQERHLISVTDALAVSLESRNTTGTYRVLGMDTHIPSTTYLGQTAGHDVDRLLELTKRDDSSVALAGANKGQRDEGRTDDNFSGYVVPFSWHFDGTANEWAAAQVVLADGGQLTAATEFSIALKLPGTLDPGTDVYVQLGVDATGQTTDETAGSIPTWNITDTSDVRMRLDRMHIGTQTVTIAVTDRDRAHLTGNHDLRLIVVNRSGTVSSGAIIVGPYEIKTKPLFLSHDTAYTVTTPLHADPSVPGAGQFNTGTNYVQAVFWNTEEPSVSHPVIIAAQYFPEVDIALYESISLRFKYAPGTDTATVVSLDSFPLLTCTLDADAERIDEEGKYAVRASIDKSDFPDDSAWHTLQIELHTGVITIDGNEIASRATVNTETLPSRLRLAVNTAPDGTIAYKRGGFYFDELILSGARPSVSLEHVTRASYTYDGVLAQKGNFPLVEDVSVSATVTERGAIATATGAVDGTVTATAQAAATFMMVRFAIDGAFSSREPAVLTTAGHRIETTAPLFKMLSFSEQYRYSRTTTALEKKSSATLSFNRFSVPLTLYGTTVATENLGQFKQNTDFGMTLALGDYAWHTTLTAKINTAQRIAARTAGYSPSNKHYFSGWYESTALSFSPGDERAAFRTVGGTISIRTAVPVAAFTPAVTFTANGTYAAGQSVLFTDQSAVTVSLPFKIWRQTFSIDWKKTGGGGAVVPQGGNYTDDATRLAAAIRRRPWFFTAFPFYDLISAKLAAAVLSATDGDTGENTSLSYSTLYSASWRRPPASPFIDLFVPSGMTLSLSRDIRTALTVSDSYQLKLTAQFAAYDLFGSTGTRPVFKWYEQDEYISSFSIGMKIPRNVPKNTFLTFSGYVQTNFYLPSTGVLQGGAEATADTEKNWNTRLSLVWKRTSALNLAAALIAALSKKYRRQHTLTTRTDTFDIALLKTATTFSQSYTVSHHVEAQLLSYFSVTYGVRGSVTAYTHAATVIGLSLSLGGKATF
ncbi:MAG: DNA polymerase IV [Treponema sp.]|nr:DNA polymerase IV [Treponema sp.]